MSDPKGKSASPPPDIPVWAFFLGLTMLQNVLIVLAAGFGQTRLGIAADSWTLVGLLTVAAGLAFIGTAFFLTLVFGLKTAARDAIKWPDE